MRHPNHQEHQDVDAHASNVCFCFFVFLSEMAGGGARRLTHPKKLFDHNIKSGGEKRFLSGIVSGESGNVYRELMLNAVRG